jgi:tetratricopeptide (TPR) repeat protein
MMKHNVVSVIALSLVLAAGFGGAGTVIAPQQAEAGQQNSVSPAVGRPLQEARELAEAKKFSEAIAKAKEAESVARKSDYESYMISEILGSIYLQAGQYGNAATTLEKSLSTGQMSAEDSRNRVKLLSQVFYQVKNYNKAIEYGQRYVKEAGQDVDTLVIVGQSQYLLKQYKPASDTMRSVIRAAQQSGKRVNETWLQLLMSTEYEQGNEAGVRDALEQLIRLYPKDNYWRDYMTLVEKDLRGGSTKTALDVLRFRLASGSMQNEKDYTDMAELALQEGLPGDAKRALEKGKAAGVIGQGPQAARHERLYKMAVERANEDRANLSAGEAEAAAMPAGDADIQFGEAYWTYGQYPEAATAIQRGIGKGVENMDQAQLRLGLAFLGAGDQSKANDAFKKITAGSPEEVIARLWTLKGSI